MGTRRDFLKKAGLLATGAGFIGALPASVRRAFAIEPEPGTTFLDAEHVVILMQENRSFDHAYGTLQGVRGFNDPRAIRQPNSNLVWLQTNTRGETYAPFRLDLKETRATWMGSLPHSWTNQVDAGNGGKHNGWLEAKRSGHKEYADMPLTLGHYTREDLPFYYALADAFTICDQHFCSSLTATMPNRLYLWSGTVRGVHDASAPAKVLNENIEYEDSAHWMTFPERLEDNGLSWEIYQNEITLDTGLTPEEVRWLGNYGDNPLEYFTQYHARVAPGYRKQLDVKIESLPVEMDAINFRLSSLPTDSPEYKRLKTRLSKTEEALRHAREQRARYTPESFKKLSRRERNLYLKAFSTNERDPDYHRLTRVRYQDQGKERQMNVPTGDVLYQFRKDVETGRLPAVSWIIAPENFSDHPSSAWFGAWYVSEALEILARHPKTWKKTIFILTYDENDGYFDHVPPFLAPHPRKRGAGAVSRGMKVEEDFVTLEEELRVKSRKEARESSIGLGYRVPLVIASPWSRGGYVCSEVFDHTSVLRFLEKFVSRKAGKTITESNISDWRRAVCGDLTSAFRAFHGEPIPLPAPVPKRQFMEQIDKAQFKKLPQACKALEKAEVDQLNENPRNSPWMPKQEPGTRPSCALPYQLYAEGALNRAEKAFEIFFAAKKDVFGEQSAGSPFNVSAPGRHLAMAAASRSRAPEWEISRRWSFAVAPGAELRYSWPLRDFDGEHYHLQVNGPNGFFREFKGDFDPGLLTVRCEYQRAAGGMGLSGNIELMLTNAASAPATVEIEDNAYEAWKRSEKLSAGGRKAIILDLAKSSGWYDFTVRLPGRTFAWRFAGRVETGETSRTDPAMGGA